MDKDEALRIALEALDQYIEKELTVGQRYTNEGQQLLDAHAILRQALDHVPDATKMIEPDMGIDRGAWDDVPDATKWVDELRGDEPWDTSDMAYRPNGLSMEQAPVTWRNAAIRLGEDLYSVGPNGYYDMTASQWLDWALSVINTAPPKPAQDLIVGYADSQDLNRAGHDFWVSRQQGKNTVPLYLYGHPPKIWQGLTQEDIPDEYDPVFDSDEFIAGMAWAQAKLKEKNR